MPAAIPDRFRLEVRLGRDGDIEEWLATDTSLDRPVLIRSVGPESSLERRRQFVASVSGAARTTHAHLARVFAVSEVDGGAYAVSEWTGGASVADRVAAHQPIDLPDFLPNASGLAGALAALHESGAVHGRIDTSAISYSGAHPAKLGAFGRIGSNDPAADVRSLAGALETALTGTAPGGPPPSERVDGVPRALDTILRSAQSGGLDAAELEKALRAAHPAGAEIGHGAHGTTSDNRRLEPGRGRHRPGRRGIRAVRGECPRCAHPHYLTRDRAHHGSHTGVHDACSRRGQRATEPLTLDPFGEGGENDQLVANVIDGDVGTSWQTERYLDPLPLLKPGAGVTVRVVGTPGALQVVQMTPGTVFEVYWATSRFEDVAAWERIAGAHSSPAATAIDLPPCSDGYWLVWLTDLPVTGDGTHQASIAELRFLP